MKQALPKPLRILNYARFVLLIAALGYAGFALFTSLTSGNPQTLQGLAIDSQDNLYVSDGSNATIHKYDFRGNLTIGWGSFGKGDGQFGEPLGLNKIAVGSQNEIYALDTTNLRVQKFNSNGKFLAKWGSDGREPGQFTSPSNIAVDKEGQVYINDSQGIQKFDSGGKFLGKLSANLPNNESLGGRSGLAVDATGMLYVVSSGEEKIFAFDAQGQLQKTITLQGYDRGQFFSLTNLALDRQGNFYLASNERAQLLKFDSAGNFLTRWKISELKNNLALYRGIALDSQGNVYVLNQLENEVEVFDGNGRSLKQFSIGWPKWISNNTFFVYLAAFFMSGGLTLFELYYRRKYNISPNKSVKSQPLSLVATISVIITLLTSFTGMLASMLMTVLYTSLSRSSLPLYNGDPPFIFISPELNSITVGWVVSILFAVMHVVAFLVYWKPLLAGILQVIGALLIFLLSLNLLIKFVAIALLIGGALAILSLADKEESPRTQ